MGGFRSAFSIIDLVSLGVFRDLYTMLNNCFNFCRVRDVNFEFSYF